MKRKQDILGQKYKLINNKDSNHKIYLKGNKNISPKIEITLPKII